MGTATIDIKKTAKEYADISKAFEKRITICAGTGCVANGALKVFEAFKKGIAAAGLPVMVELKNENVPEHSVHLSKSGCQGFCQMGPLVTVYPEMVLYTKVKPEDTTDIIESTIKKGEIIEHLLYKDPNGGALCKGTEQIPFYTRQSRTVLALCGSIDPEDINEYIYHGGYDLARRAYLDMTADTIIKTVLDSGLRGRGGGGFPTGKKWDAAKIEAGPKKFVICNGDEGDPGAFMDRSVMEGNPHSVIEGMLIAAKAIGADEGYLYVRTEYPLAVKRLRIAVREAEKAGLLGSNLFGSGLNFKLNVMEGAGAFVCGEETALMASVEGQRGMPRPKPPFPSKSGLFGKPTIINNVETFASVPLVFKMGPEKFRSIGTATSPGTKTFALTGHVCNTGLIEVPFGKTLREVVLNIGGGVLTDEGTIDPEGFKAVQIGGPSGGCLTREHLDLSLDFDSLKKVGAMVGSGGLVVMNNQTCMVSIARYFMTFTQNESCGKCVLCREGTKQLLALLDDIVEGRGTAETLALLEKLARAVQKGSLCGLGKSAPNPVLSTLRYFRDEYEEHVFNKRCPSKVCSALSPYTIDKSLCKGCSLCAKQCPVDAISGEKKMPYTIDESVCIKCGACVSACKFKAVKKG